MRKILALIIISPALLFGQIYLYNNSLQVGPNGLVDNVRLLLPDTIYCAVGQEMNVYFDNVVLVNDYRDYTFKVVCDSGAHYSQRWAYTPSVGATGGFDLSVYVYSQFGALVDSGTARVIVAADLTSGSKTILLVGDSLTDQHTYPHEVETLAGEYLTFIGTKDTGGDSTANEGSGGKAWVYHATNASSPFRTDGIMDFAGYLSENSLATPELIVLEFGVNDVFSATEKSAAEIETTLQYADSLINEILEDVAAAKVGVCYVPPPSCEQDAFGTNYYSGYSKGIYRRSVHRYNEALKARYGTSGTKKNARVSLIPIYCNLDTEHNMATTNKTYNARNSTTYSRQTNAVHPGTDGYEQMADTVYGWIVNKW